MPDPYEPSADQIATDTQGIRDNCTPSELMRRSANPSSNVAEAVLTLAGQSPGKFVDTYQTVVSGLQAINDGMVGAKAIDQNLPLLSPQQRQAAQDYAWIHDIDGNFGIMCHVHELAPNAFQEAFMKSVPEGIIDYVLGHRPCKCPLCRQTLKKRK